MNPTTLHRLEQLMRKPESEGLSAEQRSVRWRGMVA